jgi:hypothetical protein
MTAAISRTVCGTCGRTVTRCRSAQPAKASQPTTASARHSTVRSGDECRNLHWFGSLGEAQREVEAWHPYCNRAHPPTALTERVRGEFARQYGLLSWPKAHKRLESSALHFPWNLGGSLRTATPRREQNLMGRYVIIRALMYVTRPRLPLHCMDCQLAYQTWPNNTAQRHERRQIAIGAASTSSLHR